MNEGSNASLIISTDAICSSGACDLQNYSIKKNISKIIHISNLQL